MIDRQLNFKDHSKAVYNKLVYQWVCLCRYSNRHWGMHQLVLVRLVKTVMFSSLFYGCIIWMNHSNMQHINRLWYKISKSAVGAVLNVHGAILEVILGVPPLLIKKRVIAVKHYLKAFFRAEDIHLRFIKHETESGNNTSHHFGRSPRCYKVPPVETRYIPTPFQRS